MTVTKLFWEDPYCSTLETRIASISSDWVRLRETIFYAFSGGQESDTGTIGGFPVLEACCRDLEIDYRLEAGHSLTTGDPVQVDIDWQRRYRLMRLHFAAELILELTYRRLPEIEKIGAHIAEDKARLDFLWPEQISPYFPALLESAQQLIQEDRPIISDFSDREGQQRFWRIEGFAQVSCGGTHLKRTAEVGELRLKRKNIGGGKERIEIFVDDAG